MGLRVLVAHNFYGDRAAGGEATVFEQETKLLRLNGCDVTTLERSNSEITRWPVWKKCALPFHLGNSREVYRQVVELIKEKRPEILHAHNYKYVLTPSIFKAAKDCGVKTVLTLHNYRLICPGGQLRRGNEICEECLRRSPSRILWRRGCASKMSTRILQSLLYFETKKNVLENVDVFVALTDFSKRKFVEGGFPSERIWVKPNFIFDPLEQIGENASRNRRKGSNDGGLRRAQESKNGANRTGAVFVGRLSAEKGVRFLMEAWRGLDFPLTIVGDGPEEAAARKNAPSNVRFVGGKTRDEALKLVQNAQFLVFPSICYEGFPMSILEASALGTPALASKLGGRNEMTLEGETGFLFESGNIEDFRNAARRLINDSNLCRRLGENARRRYENFYSPQKNFETLMEIYRAALD
ncbi:MAG: glycosyltransferase family 4 protein [Thermoguttaceae bacterium]|nr:glycosyltransferase family 4 protein [Thermoguttaceae bacterium]